MEVCACFSQRERGRSPGRGVQGFPRAGLEALAWMAKHSALGPAYPYSTGRTHRLHDGELSPSNTPLPVGNPNPRVPTSCGRSVPSRRHMLLPGWGWPWLLGWRERQICFPTACLWGWLDLPVGFSAPQTAPGLGDARVCTRASLPALCSAGRAPSGGCQAPCWYVVLLDALPANCSCSDAFVYFSPFCAFPSPSPQPPPSNRGVLPNPIELGWKGSMLNLSGESSVCQPLVCCASSSVLCRNIVPARERQENLVEGLRQPLQSASCTSGCWRGRAGEGRGQAFPGGREGALAKMSPPKGTCTGCV